MNLLGIPAPGFVCQWLLLSGTVGKTYGSDHAERPGGHRRGKIVCHDGYENSGDCRIRYVGIDRLLENDGDRR